MSATMLTSSVLATPTRLSHKQRIPSRRVSPVCASYRSGFNANDAFRQAAQQFEKFQKQQQSQQRTQGRGTSGRAEAFRGSYGPFQWNFDADQMNKFMKVTPARSSVACDPSLGIVQPAFHWLSELFVVQS